MARIKWFSYLLNDEGQPIEGASISIYLAGTTTAVTIYTSESEVGTISSAPHLVTNEDGYFEFWVGDSSDINGYASTQKFKIAFTKTGVVSGFNDYISIFAGFIPVDLTSSSTAKDKTVSNLYAKQWEEHRVDDTAYVHGIEAVVVGSGDTTINKLVSNFYAKGWEDHKNLDYNENPHGIGLADEIDSNTVKNKLVSNNQLKTLQDNIDGLSYSGAIASGSFSASGDYYYNDITHNLGNDYPIINMYDTDDKEKITPRDVESIDTNTLRVWLNTQLNVAVKLNI